MDYLRLQGDLAGIIHLDNTSYTYAYVNKTLSTTSVSRPRPISPRASPKAMAPSSTATEISPTTCPGYTKQNAYRNWGNILRLSTRFRFRLAERPGAHRRVVGNVPPRQRARSDFDATQCFASRQLQSLARPDSFADSSIHRPKTQIRVRAFGGGFFEYNEHSGWNQYQPFVELEMHPIGRSHHHARLQICAWWNHYVNAPLEQKTKPVGPGHRAPSPPRTTCRS